MRQGKKSIKFQTSMITSSCACMYACSCCMFLVTDFSVFHTNRYKLLNDAKSVNIVCTLRHQRTRCGKHSEDNALL